MLFNEKNIFRKRLICNEFPRFAARSTQSYGIVQFGRTIKMLESRGWGRHSIFPHGGNLMTLAIVAGFGLGGCEAYPGTFGIFAGFADDSKVDAGKLTLSERPGIGFEGQNSLFEVMRQIIPSLSGA